MERTNEGRLDSAAEGRTGVVHSAQAQERVLRHIVDLINATSVRALDIDLRMLVPNEKDRARGDFSLADLIASDVVSSLAKDDWDVLNEQFDDALESLTALVEESLCITPIDWQDLTRSSVLA